MYHLCSSDCSTKFCQELYDVESTNIEKIEQQKHSMPIANQAIVNTDSDNSDSSSKSWILTIGWIALSVCGLVFIVALIIYLWSMYQARKNDTGKPKPSMCIATYDLGLTCIVNICLNCFVCNSKNRRSDWKRIG